MPTQDLERIRDVKQRAEGRLLGIPGVTGVGLGAKYVGGVHTGKPAIIVMVERKKLPADVRPEELIPPEIEGVATDVLESGVPRQLCDAGRERPLLGGIKVTAGGNLGGAGTLGFIAHTNEPVPRLVAVTNHHVVADLPFAQHTNLIVNHSIVGLPTSGFTISGSNTPGSLIALWFYLTQGETEFPTHWAFYPTKHGDTLTTIAEGVRDTVNSLATGITAKANFVTGSVEIVSPPGRGLRWDVTVYGPHPSYPDIDLSGDVETNEITLAGKASNGYGVYVNWNAGGLEPTRGTLARVRKGMELEQIASDIATRINAQGHPGILASAVGKKVRIAGAQHVECTVSSDLGVGQPNSTAASECCACCRDRIGSVYDSRVDVDAALIALSPGVQYHPDIAELGVIKGTRTITFADLLQQIPVVWKRGAKTGKTMGVIRSVETSSHLIAFGATGTPLEWRLFKRRFKDAISILSDGPFSDHGDSGSAIIDDNHMVVGLLFGGDGEFSLATAIGPIEKAFNLSVEFGVGTQAGEVRTVPEIPGDAMVAASRSIFIDRLGEMEQQIAASDLGRELIAAGRRHAVEVVTLVNHNRRVGTVWRRSGGAELLSRLLALFQNDELPARLPQEVDGHPTTDTLRAMQTILLRFGSDELKRDLHKFGARIIELTKLDYPGFLAVLGAERAA